MNTNGHDRPDPLAEVLRQAGARPEADAACKARVEVAVRRAWQAGLRRRRWQRVGWALAAGVAAFAVLIGLHGLQGTQSPVDVDVAVVLHVQGDAYQEDARGRRTLSMGDRLRSGASIVTDAQGRVALRLEHIESVRLDQRTRLRLVDPRELVLDDGGVYLDSGAGAGGVRVVTPLLTASDVGTRFMVRHDATAGSRVGVRDGSVDILADTAMRLAGGEQYRLAPSGAGERTPLATDAPDWNWARSAAAPFAAEGKPFRALFGWYAHEAGLGLRIAPDAALQARLDAPIQGDLSGLEPDALLAVARAAGAFSLRIDRERKELHIER